LVIILIVLLLISFSAY
ncbi:type I toxin-antitoxin system toxin IbsC, partial [Escherichia coli]